MANATSLANRIEAIFDEEEPEQDWLEHRVSPDLVGALAKFASWAESPGFSSRS